MDFTDLPFEYATRYGDQFKDWGIPIEQAAELEDRDRQIEDYLAKTATPLIFHWPGGVDDHVNVRNGPGKFAYSGTIYRIDWAWDTAPASAATVEWYFDNSASATHTSTVSTATDSTEQPGLSYAGERIVPIVTSVDSTASGLTAFVFLG